LIGQATLFGDDGGGKRPRRGAVAAAEVTKDIIALAAALPRSLRFGTSTWSFSGWQGLVYSGDYPEPKLAREGLAAYAAHPLLRSVGVDRSFYAPLDEPTLRRMAGTVGSDFRFLIKAHAALMLPRSARRPEYLEGMPDVFLDAGYATRVVIEPALRHLGEKLGVILFQFSPLGERVLRYRCELLQRLDDFLTALPREARYAIEWRDRELLGDDYADMLVRHGVAHGHASHPRLPSVDAQAVFDRSPAGDVHRVPLVLRWLLAPGKGYEEARAAYAPFDRLVDPDVETRERIVTLARQALERGREVLIIVNNKAEGSAPRSVVELARAFAAVG
jgi:uncharacterized protein YecE (DUF72 family)